LIAVANAGGTAQGHGKNDVSAKSDDFSGPMAVAGIDNFAGLANGAEGPFGFDELANDLHNATAPAQCG
jgi:hypothetical protein